MTKQETQWRETQWYDFISLKNRYIGGEVISHESSDDRYRGIITDITFNKSYLKIYTNNPEHLVEGEWEDMDRELTYGCSIEHASFPHIHQEGIAFIYFPYIGDVFLSPSADTPDFSDKVVVMQSGIKDGDGHIWSVEAAECYADEVGGVVEYLNNGKVKVWGNAPLTS